MVIIDDLENFEIVGGGFFRKGFLYGIVAIGILVVGIIDGIVRPLSCKK